MTVVTLFSVVENNTDCYCSPTSLPVPTNGGIILEGSVVKE